MVYTKEYQENKELYLTGGVATAYTATYPGLQSYDDGRALKIRFHVTNGVSATLNINAIGAKALVDHNNTALPVSLFNINGVYDFCYNTTNDNFVYVNATTSQIYGTSTPPAGITVSEIAGETITSGDAVFKGFLRENVVYAPAATGNFSLTQATPITVGQSIPVSTNPRLMQGVTFQVNTNGFGTGTMTAYIFAASGTLGNYIMTGGVLATSTNTIITTVSGSQTFFFNGFRLDANVNYIVSLNSVFVNGSQVANVLYDDPGALANSNACDDTAGGTAYPTRDLLIEMDMCIAREYVYKTNTTNIEKALFYGFALSSATVGQAVTVQRSGIFTTIGLTDGADYYITNTPGAIGTSVGSITVLVGRAISTTELLIEPQIVISSYNTFLVGQVNYFLSSSSFVEAETANNGSGGSPLALTISADYSISPSTLRSAVSNIPSAASGQRFTTITSLQSGKFFNIVANNGVSGNLVNFINIYPYK